MESEEPIVLTKTLSQNSFLNKFESQKKKWLLTK